MTRTCTSETTRWNFSTGLPPLHDQGKRCPQGMLLHDRETEDDRVAVVYKRGHPPPKITIDRISSNVHTVRADGVAVAVVARAGGPVVSIDEVLLVEQCV
jgi:hypothetical protein